MEARKIPELKRLAPHRPSLHADIEVVSEKKMIELNRYYKKKNRPTDVLSFPGPEPFYSMGFLGELVICLPVMKKQAQENNIDPEIEFLILLVHGVLHLFGLDHTSGASEAKRMAEYENKILKSVVPAQWQKQRLSGGIQGLIARGG